MKTKFGFVYIWRDRKHNRFYIGSHWGPEDDGYICSSSWMKLSYKKRPQDFKRRILERFDDISYRGLLEREDKWLALISDEQLGIRYYNYHKNAIHWVSSTPQELITEKMRKTEEWKRKISEGNKR
jgi:hypothetical protein